MRLRGRGNGLLRRRLYRRLLKGVVGRGDGGEGGGEVLGLEGVGGLMPVGWMGLRTGERRIGRGEGGLVVGLVVEVEVEVG